MYMVKLDKLHKNKKILYNKRSDHFLSILLFSVRICSNACIHHRVSRWCICWQIHSQPRNFQGVGIVAGRCGW